MPRERFPAPQPRRGSTHRHRVLRTKVLQRDGYICQLCGEPATHVDHITPVSQGGTDTLENLRAACATCNLRRGAPPDRA